MLTVKTKNTYRKGTSIVNVYAIASTLTGAEAKKELDAYAKIAGDKLRKDGETMLFFSTDFVSDGTELIVNQAGTKAYLKTDLQEVAAKLVDETQKAIGKIQAVASVLGINKREAAKMMLSA